MSRPWMSQPMVYGWGCCVIVKFKLLTTSTEIRFFSLPLSTMKWIGVPFTHICDWKRHSHSSGSSGSSGWNFVVAMVTLGSASMICLPYSGSKLESELTSHPGDFVSAKKYYLERHSSVLGQWILWNSHHFRVSFFEFPLLFFVGGLGWLSWGWPSLLCPFSWELEPPLPYFDYYIFADPNSLLFYCLKLCLILTTYL